MLFMEVIKWRKKKFQNPWLLHRNDEERNDYVSYIMKNHRNKWYYWFILAQLGSGCIFTIEELMFYEK